ncbi:HalOD1 output domain-containing protein [Halogranum rubrum]|uniref:Halobacterial output domain-containing protein n=1 Tax=Halogranum salarium B-1 TaxID=1210908 RepID=J2ZDK0_9EURY|nr:HalOD1 output domain-containing protein [Halogranum salarium]EJN58745.1 hypothetical protein HSB1_32230 [Halogranum salarium B-1]
MQRDRDEWSGSVSDGAVATSTYYTEFTGDEPVSMAVVRAVAAVTGIEPAVLTPLGECIETDALETLFGTPVGTMAARSLRFNYAGCLVTVCGDGSISLTVPEYENSNGVENY